MSMLGKGRKLPSPASFRWRNWIYVLKRVLFGIGDDNLSLVAAGCAFYAMLALVPGLTVLVLVYGLVADAQHVGRHLEMLSGLVPGDVMSMLSEQMLRIADQSDANLSWGLAAALTVALWSASAATKSLLLALNIAYREHEKRNLVVFNLVGLGFTLAGIVALVTALATIVGVPAVLGVVGLGQLAEFLMRILRWPLLGALVIVGLAVLYRYGPSRNTPKMRWISPGALTAMGLWLVASILFSVYVGKFADYNATFGSLGAIIVVLFWLYISVFVIILGAKLNGELEHETAVDTTVGTPRPMGHRGAYVADHVARHSTSD